MTWLSVVTLHMTGSNFYDLGKNKPSKNVRAEAVSSGKKSNRKGVLVSI